MNNLIDRIMAKHNAVMAKARQLFPQYANAPEPSVYFFNTGRSAGLAHGYSKVGYNTHIFGQDSDRFINSTIPHEIAHIVCAYLNYDRGHGKNWKRICLLLGGNAERCFSGANIDIAMARKRKKYEYRGSCGTIIMVTDVMHGKIQRGGQYHLRSTRGTLSPSGFTGKII